MEIRMLILSYFHASVSCKKSPSITPKKPIRNTKKTSRMGFFITLTTLTVPFLMIPFLMVPFLMVPFAGSPYHWLS